MHLILAVFSPLFCPFCRFGQGRPGGLKKGDQKGVIFDPPKVTTRPIYHVFGHFWPFLGFWGSKMEPFWTPFWIHFLRGPAQKVSYVRMYWPKPVKKGVQNGGQKGVENGHFWGQKVVIFDPSQGWPGLAQMAQTGQNPFIFIVWEGYIGQNSPYGPYGPYGLAGPYGPGLASTGPATPHS